MNNVSIEDIIKAKLDSGRTISEEDKQLFTKVWKELGDDLTDRCIAEISTIGTEATLLLSWNNVGKSTVVHFSFKANSKSIVVRVMKDESIYSEVYFGGDKYKLYGTLSLMNRTGIIHFIRSL